MRKKLLMVGLIALLLGGLFTSVGQAAGPPKQEDGQEYVVQADDWLSKLANKYLGNGNLWPRIVEATNARAATDPRRLAFSATVPLKHGKNIIEVVARENERVVSTHTTVVLRK